MVFKNISNALNLALSVFSLLNIVAISSMISTGFSFIGLLLNVFFFSPFTNSNGLFLTNFAAKIASFIFSIKAFFVKLWLTMKLDVPKYSPLLWYIVTIASLVSTNRTVSNFPRT